MSSARAAASLLLAFGRLGLRSASWGDSLEMIALVEVVLRELNGLSISHHLLSTSEAAVDLASQGSQCQRGTSLSLVGRFTILVIVRPPMKQ